MGVICQESYSYPADIYSLGVFIWVFLSGGSIAVQQPGPPTGGKGKDFDSYASDWELLEAAIQNPEQARCPIDASAVEVISQMTQQSQLDRPDCADLRKTAFFQDLCLPVIDTGSPPA